MACSPFPYGISIPENHKVSDDVAYMMLEFSSRQPSGMYSNYNDKIGLSALWMTKITDQGWMSIAFPGGIGSLYAEWDRHNHKPLLRYMPDCQSFLTNFQNQFWQQVSANPTGVYGALYEVIEKVLPTLVKYGD